MNILKKAVRQRSFRGFAILGLALMILPAVATEASAQYRRGGFYGRGYRGGVYSRGYSGGYRGYPARGFGYYSPRSYGYAPRAFAPPVYGPRYYGRGYNSFYNYGVPYNYGTPFFGPGFSLSIGGSPY